MGYGTTLPAPATEKVFVYMHVVLKLIEDAAISVPILGRWSI